MIPPHRLVAAFAAPPYAGNRAAVFDGEGWEPAEMQRIAATLGEPACAFLSPAEGATRAVRWFSPVAQIALCGHGALAAGFVLLDGAEGEVVLRMASGASVAIAGDGERVALEADALPVSPIDPAPMRAIFGSAVIEGHRHPAGYTICRFADEAAVRALAPDLPTDVPAEQVSCTAPGSATDIVSRVFRTGSGAGEDAVTGSAHTLLAPYWAGRLGKRALTALQASREGGLLELTMLGAKVRIGGECRLLEPRSP